MPDIKQAIEDNASGPRKVEGDTGSVEQHRLKDQIEADRYLATQIAIKKPRRGLRYNRFS